MHSSDHRHRVLPHCDMSSWAMAFACFGEIEREPSTHLMNIGDRNGGGKDAILATGHCSDEDSNLRSQDDTGSREESHRPGSGLAYDTDTTTGRTSVAKKRVLKLLYV